MSIRKCKKFFAVIMALSMITGQTIYADASQNDLKDKDLKIRNIEFEKDINLLEEILPETKDNLSEREKSVVENVEVLANDNAVEAAETLNLIQDDIVYEAALKEVLDNYYSEESLESEQQVEILAATVDERADDMLEDYKAAKEERDNSEYLDYETGKVVVTFEAGTKEENIAEIAERMGGSYSILNNCPINEELSEDKLEQLEAIRDREFPVIVCMDIGLGKTVAMAEEVLENLSCVIDSDPNGTASEPDSLKTDLGVNDPFVNEQKYLKQIKFPEAWQTWKETDIDELCSRIDIAVIDTGLDISHEDLKKQYVKDRSVSLIQNGTNVEIQAMNAGNAYLRGVNDGYHGTHVAGIIAAKPNNKAGVVGVASVADSRNIFVESDYKIMAINAASKGVNKYGEPVCVFYDSVLIKAIDYAVKNGASVINMSLGGAGYNSAMQEVINQAHAADVIICAAAGNGALEGNKISYPASYEHVISVGSLDANNAKASTSTYNNYVDIAAPGESIYNCGLNSTYTYCSGTSMATPVVAAVAGVLSAMRGDSTVVNRLKAADIESILYDTATDLYTAGKDIYTGYGLLNLNLAIQTAKSRFLAATAPQAVKITVKDYNSIKLAWQGVSWAERYQVYRSGSLNGTYEKIKVIYSKNAELNGNFKVIFTDTGLKTGKTYYYKIRAVAAYKDTVSHSGYSVTVSARPVTSAPIITAAVSKGKITLSWKKISGASGYVVFRSTSANGTYTKLKKITSGDTVTYADTTVKAGKTYYYKVRSYRVVNNENVNSEFSAIVHKKAK